MNESSSSSWQWPWAASGDINMWNPLLCAMADVIAGPVLDDMVSEVDMGRVALTCHFSLDVLCSEMHQPHVFLQVLSLEVLIPVNEVRKACGIPEPAKSVQILFRGGHGLGVWKLGAEQSLAEWYSGEKLVGGLDGYFAPVGGKIFDSAVKVGSLGLGYMAEVVFHRRPLGGSFGGMVKGGCLRGTGEWTCSNSDCWSTRYSCYRCGVPRYFDGSCMGQGHFGAGPGKGGGIPGLQGQGVGAGMSGVRLVGAFGRHQTYISRGNPTHRKGNGRRGNGREGSVPGAGVGPGGNRVRFQEIPEDTTAAGRVRVEAAGAAPKGQGKTQRDWRSWSGSDVCFDRESFIQERQW